MYFQRRKDVLEYGETSRRRKRTISLDTMGRVQRAEISLYVNVIVGIYQL